MGGPIQNMGATEIVAYTPRMKKEETRHLFGRYLPPKKKALSKLIRNYSYNLIYKNSQVKIVNRILDR